MFSDVFYVLHYVCLCSCRSCIQRVVDNTYEFTTVRTPYSSKLFPPDTFLNLKHPSGAVLDILQLLAEFLLTIDYDDLILKPAIMMNEITGERQISTYATGKQFEKICSVIAQEYGDDVYPIILQFNGDGMPVDGLGNQDPKFAYVLNDACYRFYL